MLLLLLLDLETLLDCSDTGGFLGLFALLFLGKRLLDLGNEIALVLLLCGLALVEALRLRQGAVESRNQAVDAVDMLLSRPQKVVALLLRRREEQAHRPRAFGFLFLLLLVKLNLEVDFFDQFLEPLLGAQEIVHRHANIRNAAVAALTAAQWLLAHFLSDNAQIVPELEIHVLLLHGVGFNVPELFEDHRSGLIVADLEMGAREIQMELTIICEPSAGCVDQLARRKRTDRVELLENLLVHLDAPLVFPREADGVREIEPRVLEVIRALADEREAVLGLLDEALLAKNASEAVCSENVARVSLEHGLENVKCPVEMLLHLGRVGLLGRHAQIGVADRQLCIVVCLGGGFCDLGIACRCRRGGGALGALLLEQGMSLCGLGLDGLGHLLELGDGLVPLFAQNADVAVDAECIGAVWLVLECLLDKLGCGVEIASVHGHDRKAQIAVRVVWERSENQTVEGLCLSGLLGVLGQTGQVVDGGDLGGADAGHCLDDRRHKGLAVGLFGTDVVALALAEHASIVVELGGHWLLGLDEQTQCILEIGAGELWV
eukprot:comp22457_c0_seq1/m.55292 comp22457_c0_seq1/g.55292  ORF comp22457_c0_seq1/g.55292 comp22457_c0_seq1/m.55292 type:complete len:548 (-) comp22457_c0_seq1:1384-3027(-)